MKMNKLITVCFLLIFSISSMAQNKEVYMEDKTDWEVFEELNGVVFSSKVVEYHDLINDEHMEYYLVKLTNTTDVKMEISTKKTVWYDGECFNCDSDDEEYTLNFTLEGSEEIKGNPVEKMYNNLVLYKKFLDYPVREATKFEFQNLTVKPE